VQIVHLVRHGQGFHNVAGEAEYELYKSWDYEDAHLTETGWQQVGLATTSAARLASQAWGMEHAAALHVWLGGSRRHVLLSLHGN